MTGPRAHPCGRCGEPLAPWGFTRPSSLRERQEGDVTVWACAAHRQEARARAAEIMGYELERRERPAPAQGRLDL